MKGLDAGRSFVTTGPMLLAKINRDLPGGRFESKAGRKRKVQVTGTVLSKQPVHSVEIIVNGDMAATIDLKPKQCRTGAWEATFRAKVQVAGTSWVAVRCWEPRDQTRFRFAHTAPTWFEDPSHPILPMKQEIDFLLKRMDEQIRRHTGVLSPEAVAEYHQAKAIYEEIAARVR